MSIRAAFVCASACALLAAQGQAIEIANPSLGLSTTHQCEGLHGNTIAFDVVAVDDWTYRVEGEIDGEARMVVKPIAGTGATFYITRDNAGEERAMDFDRDDNRTIEALAANQVAMFDLTEDKPGKSNRWPYEYSFEGPAPLDHPVAGMVNVIKITEKRDLKRSRYSAEFTSFVDIDRGVLLDFVYKDTKSKQDCKLVEVSGQ